MKQAIPLWISAISLLSIAMSFLYLIALNWTALNDPKTFLGLVAAITAAVTTMGSFYIAGFNSRKKEEQDRATESRKLKIDYYFTLVEALTRKLSRPDDKEANLTFCIEKNRLPLYASEELIRIIERIAKGSATDAGPLPTYTDLYSAMRSDLATSAFATLDKHSVDLSFHTDSQQAQ